MLYPILLVNIIIQQLQLIVIEYLQYAWLYKMGPNYFFEWLRHSKFQLYAVYKQ